MNTRVQRGVRGIPDVDAPDFLPRLREAFLLVQDQAKATAGTVATPRGPAISLGPVGP